MKLDPSPAPGNAGTNPLVLPPATIGEEVTLPDATRLAMLTAFQRYGPILTELLIVAAADILDRPRDFEPSESCNTKLHAFAIAHGKGEAQMRAAMADLVAGRKTDRALQRFTKALTKLSKAVTTVHGFVIADLQQTLAEPLDPDDNPIVAIESRAEIVGRHGRRFNGIRSIVEGIAVFSQFGAARCIGVSSQDFSKAAASIGFDPPFSLPRDQLVLPGQPFFIVALALSETFRTIRMDIVAGDLPRVFRSGSGNSLGAALQEASIETAAEPDEYDLCINFGPETSPSVIFELRIPHTISFDPVAFQARHRSRCNLVCELASDLGISVREESVEWIAGTSISDPSRVRFTFGVAKGITTVNQPFDPEVQARVSEIAKLARKDLSSGDILVPLEGDASRFLLLDRSIVNLGAGWIPRVCPIFLIVQTLPELGTSRLLCSDSGILVLELNAQPIADEIVGASNVLGEFSNPPDRASEADENEPPFEEAYPKGLFLNADTLLEEGCGDTVSKLIGLGAHWEASLVDFRVIDLKAMVSFFKTVVEQISTTFEKTPSDLTIQISPVVPVLHPSWVNFQILVSGIPVPIIGAIDLETATGRYQHPSDMSQMSLPPGLPEAFRASFTTVRGGSRLRPVNPKLLVKELAKHSFDVSEAVCEELVGLERRLLSSGAPFDFGGMLELFLVDGLLVWERRETSVFVTFRDDREEGEQPNVA